MTGVLLPNIPDEIYNSRPLMKDVKDRAHARAAGADAVLQTFLIATAAHIPAHVSIDTGIGVPVRPTLYGVLAGPPGVGKSTAFGVGWSLSGDHPDPLTPSTGQGMIESYYGTVLVSRQKPDGTTELKPARRRVIDNRFFYLDEGEALFKQLESSTNILGETLRSMWSGGPVGQANADVTTRRTLAAGSYTAGLVLGLQPDVAGRLLADTGTGMSQRFWWVAVVDPNIPARPSGPAQPFALGPLCWKPPTTLPGGLDAWKVPTPPIEGTEYIEREPPPAVLMTLDPAIRDEIHDYQVRLRRGEVEPDEQDSQRTAMGIKLAGVLAWTDGRLNINRDDWDIAGALLNTSAAVRDALIEHAERMKAQGLAEKGAERAQISQAETNAEVTRQRCEERVIAVLGRDEHLPTGLAHHELKKSVTGAQRPFLPEVLEDLIERGAVGVEPTAQSGRRYRLGGNGS